MGSKKNIWIELIVVAVLIAVGVWALKKDPAPVENKNNTAVTPPLGSVSTGGVNDTSPATSMSYENALVQYKDKRIQLETTCQASPDRSTFKNGTSIMIDNRSAKTRTVKLGSTYTIKPYGFQIVNLSTTMLPAIWYVDCDTAQNVATVIIQK